MSMILARYFGRIAAQWFGLIFVGFSVIVYSATTLELLRRSASKGSVSVGMVLELAALDLPHAALQLLPFAVLFSSMMTFWRLNRTNELVVVRSAGISVWGLIAPLVMLALVLGCVKIALFNGLAAAGFARYEALEARWLTNPADTGTGSAFELWLRQPMPDGSAIIYASRTPGDPAHFDDVVIMVFDRADDFTGRLQASSGALLPGRWEFQKTYQVTSGQNPRWLGTYTIPTRYTLSTIQQSFARPDMMPFWSLPGFIKLLESAGFSATKHRVYFQSQLAVPLLLVAMVLIAAVVCLRPPRRGAAASIVASGVVAGFLLYFGSNVLYSIGLSGAIPTVLAGWAPACIASLVALAALLYLEDG